jgi:hypothetical protein
VDKTGTNFLAAVAWQKISEADQKYVSKKSKTILPVYTFLLLLTFAR